MTANLSSSFSQLAARSPNSHQSSQPVSQPATRKYTRTQITNEPTARRTAQTSGRLLLAAICCCCCCCYHDKGDSRPLEPQQSASHSGDLCWPKLPPDTANCTQRRAVVMPTLAFNSRPPDTHCSSPVISLLGCLSQPVSARVV